jgi:hypothetical protein
MAVAMNQVQGKLAVSEDDREAMRRLRKIPNVGPATARDLLRLGIRRIEDAADQDGDDLYWALCAADGVRHDPCVRDVFAAVVAYARDGVPRPWWAFTPERKTRETRSAEVGTRN